MSEYGCKECWSSEASEAWRAVTSIPIQAYLIDESHYIVSIRMCPSCSSKRLDSEVIEGVGVGRQSLKFDWPNNQEPSTYWGRGVRVGVHD